MNAYEETRVNAWLGSLYALRSEIERTKSRVQAAIDHAESAIKRGAAYGCWDGPVSAALTRATLDLSAMLSAYRKRK